MEALFNVPTCQLWYQGDWSLNVIKGAGRREWVAHSHAAGQDTTRVSMGAGEEWHTILLVVVYVAHFFFLMGVEFWVSDRGKAIIIPQIFIRNIKKMV